MKQKKREAARAKLKDPEFMLALQKQGCWMCAKIHTPEYMRSMQFKLDHNDWDHISDVVSLLNIDEDKQDWSWARNTDCKYLDVRIDMRDGGCLIMAKGKRISPKQLAWQYSSETPNPVQDAEAY